MATYVYPEPEDLKFNDPLIEDTAEFRSEPRDYLKIQIISSENNSYSNYVSRSGGAAGSFNQTNISSSDTIYLYVPSNLSESYQQGYNTESIGMMGAGVLNMMNGRSDMQSMSAELKGAAQGLKPEIAINAMAGALSGINQLVGTESSLSNNGVAQLTKGAVLNPYKELIYQGTDFRSHQFSFKLVARSFKDSDVINKIIETIRYAMHPGISGVMPDEQFGTETDKFNPTKFNASADRWLLLPDFFKLELVRVSGAGVGGQNQKLEKLIQFKTYCVLEGMTVNFTPDGNYSPIKTYSTGANFGDYGVVAMQMDLQFKETAMLTKANWNAAGRKPNSITTPPPTITPAPGGKK